MKHIYLLFTVFIFSACSKEEGYGPFNLKEGQEVELLVSHRYGAIGDIPLLLPQNESPQLALSGFDDREAGYTYRVKAKMVAYKGPQMMDGGPGHALQFMETISKEKYEGNETFELSLVRSIVPGPDVIWLQKDEGKYMYILNMGVQIQLTYTDEQVGEKLEEIWQHNKEIRQGYAEGIYNNIKWTSITATVTHDPEKFGKAYLVSHIKLDE
ncbi:hypothetical protein [Sphingobacterium haloxyli]|uniref:DUF4377 domain-containing protein n=1 Tax=Sphingobacterium haloxyli TaxID=2100533 RepID=A0A2S9J7P1_9SPHI|nr:hypothetical protein [Sphingobacterium haloxyli]PRD48813.1 hypothetical protein C5745_02400 [Sphingobacterium haloxyli]